MIARRPALTAQQAAWRQIGALMINAPAKVRDQYRGLPDAELLTALRNTRPSAIANLDHADTLFALRTLAKRHRDLTAEITEIQERMRARVTAANPALLAIKGVGPVIGAQLLITAGDNPDRLRDDASFAALCGAAPVPVSSGRTDRFRLSHGGDRAANCALHLMINNRMSNDSRTRAYRDAHLAKGWTKKAVYRALKRAVAREVFRALTGHCVVPDYSDLRPTRQARNLTLTAAANQLGVWPTVISQLERGKRRNDDLANAYRAWLHAA